MAELFKWVSETPVAGQILVLALGLFVLAFCCAVILFIWAFIKDRPIAMFGFRLPEARLVYEVAETAIPEDKKPANLYAAEAIYDGERSAQTYCRFTKQFKEKPELVIGLVKIDAGCDSGGIVRLGVSAENITREGFTLRFATWNRSRLFSGSVSWMAIGR